MKIVLASDEYYPLHHEIIYFLENKKYEVILLGACLSHKDESWVQVAREASKLIQQNICHEGIFCCWTGTGITMAANKMFGIRAALCTTPELAAGARLWNHANVLGLSNQMTTSDLLLSILEAWFEPYDKNKGLIGVQELYDLESDILACS